MRTGTERVGYAELAARADAIAGRLAAAGAVRESVVAVALPRGADLVAALLAVGRTGAAYLPIDPDFPADRIAYMLADSGARLLVTTPELDPVLPAGPARLLLDPGAPAGGTAPGGPAGRCPSWTRTPTRPPTCSTPPVPPGAPRAWWSRTARCSTSCWTWRSGSRWTPATGGWR
ncbi:AMP-binding protein [Nocardiopsis composta]